MPLLSRWIYISCMFKCLIDFCIEHWGLSIDSDTKSMHQNNEKEHYLKNCVLVVKHYW